jgi:hypothetical protein
VNFPPIYIVSIWTHRTYRSTMSANTTALITDFPKLAELQENDLKDVLSDDRLTNAVLFTVPAVTAVMDEQEKLSRDNEELASKFHMRQHDDDDMLQCLSFCANPTG